MVDKKQGRRYTQLHDELTQVYNKKEDNRKAILELSEDSRALFQKVKEAGTESDETTAGNVVDKALKESNDKRLMEIVKMFQVFFAGFSGYMESSAAVHDQVTKLMEEIMKQQKRLGSMPLTRKQIDDILDTLQKNITSSDNQINASVTKFEVFFNEFGHIKAAYQHVLKAESEEQQPFDVFYHTSKENLSPELAALDDKDYELMHFMLDVFRKWHSDFRILQSIHIQPLLNTPKKHMRK